MSHTLLEAYSEAVPIGSTDLRDEAERIWRDDDVAGRDMLAGRIQLFGPGGRALATTADYLWCPEVGRLGIANGADAEWLDADSLDEGIQVWLSEMAERRAKCPDDLRYDGLEGCGSNNVEGPDVEGFYDCLNCGLWFDPTYTQEEVDA